MDSVPAETMSTLLLVLRELDSQIDVPDLFPRLERIEGGSEQLLSLFVDSSRRCCGPIGWRTRTA